VIYDIPLDVTELKEGVDKDNKLSNGAKQGRNDFRKIGYGGPCPPPGGAHRYFFKLYALDTMLNLEAGLTKKALLKKIEGHVIEEAQIIGKFKR
jgi:Raf kinase inhibitor-like YbhB/YbcL family protein